MQNSSYLSVKAGRTPAMLALVKQLGSKNKNESLAAAEAIAAVVSQPILEVIQQAPVISNFFKVWTIGENDQPKIPLDLFFDVRQRNFLNVWNQVQGGGLATSQVVGMSDLYVALYNLVGSASLKKSYARSANLDVLSRTLERLAQEVLIKRNNNSAAVFMGSLAGGRIDGNVNNTAATNLQLLRAATQGTFGLDEFNQLMVKYRAIVSSWVGGTPVGTRASLTDLLGSPNWMGQIRAIAYQPQNTRAGHSVVNGSNYASESSIAAPDAVREAAFNAAGNQTFFDITLHELNEFGQTIPNTYQGIYNQVFADYSGGNSYDGYGTGSSAVFAPASEEVVVGINTSMFDLVSMRQANESGDWTLAADDQFPLRSDTVGWYGQLTEGYVSVDNRAKIGMIF